MKTKPVLDWAHLGNNTVQATGRTMDNFVAQHQDKSRNALSKAVEASFLAWLEELRADEAQFSAEKIMMLGVICWQYFLMLL